MLSFRCPFAKRPTSSFVINNGGYTVERYFHGFEMKYNDVPAWDYGKLFEAFSPDLQVNGYKVSKASELDKLMSDEGFQNATIPQVSYSEGETSHSSLLVRYLTELPADCGYGN